MARAQSCRVLENGAILPLSLARAHTVGISTIFTEVKIKRSTSSKVSAAVLKTHAHKTSVNRVCRKIKMFIKVSRLTRNVDFSLI